MLKRTSYYVEDQLFHRVLEHRLDVDFKLSINKPTGDFFYDSWVIKDEYRGTVWEELYNTLPENKGEARFIKLDPGTSYLAHSDMDNRWHLNIYAKESYLINLTDNLLYPIVTDQYWYYMDAGKYHTAANFGNTERLQFVVRELFKHRSLLSPTTVKIKLKEFRHDYRYEFDRTISPWLNKVNTLGLIDNFKYVNEEVEFAIEKDLIAELKNITPDCFEIV